MTTVNDLYTYFDALLPRTLSCPWDNDGLMVAEDETRPIHRVLCCVDVTDDTIDEAMRIGAQMMLSHHPTIFHPLASLTPGTAPAQLVLRLLREGISAASFHTRLDAAPGGINDLLAEALGLADTTPFGPDGEKMGRVGSLCCPVKAEEMVATVREVLRCGSVRCVLPNRRSSRIAVLGGGGKEFVASAIAAGADTFVTGEMSYDAMLDAATLGLNVLEAGHFETEHVAISFFMRHIETAFPDCEAIASTCPPPLLYR